jgi:cell wall-associated NlpC family hydrolase
VTDNWAVYIEKALAWAKEQVGSDAYAFRCLAFVEDAYEIANQIEIFGGSTAAESAGEYGTQTEPSIPPEGVFVFYDSFGTLFNTYKNWGHVGLSLGDGSVVHAWDKVRIDDYLSVEKLQGAAGWTQPSYLGWTPVARVLQGYRKKAPGER